MKQLIEQLCATLNEGRDAVLATVCSQSGSTPRMAGARMLVLRDGRIRGTVGGGVAEAAVIRAAATCFDNRSPRQYTFDLVSDGIAPGGMLCGGRLTCCLEYIAADPCNRAVFHHLLAALQACRRTLLVSPLDAGSDDARFLVDLKDGTAVPEIPAEVCTAVRQLPPAAVILFTAAGRSWLAASFAAGGTLILIGAGHVAACTAEAAARVGYRVVVLDDRAEFATRERFPLADEIRVLPSFAGCLPEQEVDGDTCLVIATRSHQHDLEVLAQALQTGAGYIGMIGSRRKRDTIFARLMDRGVTAAQLEQVHCPIGLHIGAETPEEIAVAIVGELIQHRAAARKQSRPA